VQPLHKNVVVVTGVVLVLLGIGNWATGEVRLREHEELIASIEHAAPGEAKAATHNADGDDEELELARVRMDFYHVVATGGRLVTAIGLVLTAIGLARYLRARGRTSSLRTTRPDESG